MKTHLFALLVAICLVASTAWTTTQPAGVAAAWSAAAHSISGFGACQLDVCG